MTTLAVIIQTTLFFHSHKMNFPQLDFTVSINFYILPLIPKEKMLSLHSFSTYLVGKGFGQVQTTRKSNTSFFA